MEEVPGPKDDCFIYFHDESQKLFVLNRVINGIKYFRCWTETCEVGVNVPRFGPVNITGGVHSFYCGNHNNAIVKRRFFFMKMLRDRSKEELIDLRTIYDEVALLARQENVILDNYSRNIKQMMQRCRRKSLPPLPIDFYEADIHLRNPRYHRFAIETGPAGRPFYGGISEVDYTESILYFYSPSVKEVLEIPHEFPNLDLHMDATFKVVPRQQPRVYQLFVIHVVYNEHIYPLMYVMMESKRRVTYECVLRTFNDEVLRNAYPIRRVMTDFELALRQAIRNIFPDATLLGCWFHFAQAVFKKARQMGLVGHANVHPDVRQSVHMAMALPLLPQEDFDMGVIAVEQFLTRAVTFDEPRRPAVPLFLRYIRRQWAQQNISVFGQPARTNSAVESFHASLNRLVKRPHPNLWKCISFLQKHEHAKGLEIFQESRGNPPVRRLARRQQVFAARLEHAQQIYQARNRDGEHQEAVSHFLRHMSHTADNLEIFFRDHLEVPEAEDPVEDPDAIEDVAEDRLQNMAEEVEIPLENREGNEIVANDALPEMADEIDNPVGVEEELCHICRIQERAFLHVPCGHYGVCEQCLNEITRRHMPCSVCRSEIRSNVRVFSAGV